MTDQPNPKTMAKTLRAALAEYGFTLSHAQCLELVARQLGHVDWNVAAAAFAGKHPDPSDDKASDDGALLLPEGWFIADHTRRTGHYRIGLDPREPGTALIESRAGAELPPDQTGVLMQSIAADAYRGQRLRLRAQLRCQSAGNASIWMRVDGPGGGRGLQFDNMLHRREAGAIQGTVDWVERSVVLDVADNAESVHFGMLLVGHGRLWARNFQIESVDPDVATTGKPPLPPRPSNLGFDGPTLN